MTAEDIQNSLYFVHVELPEDARLLDPPPYPDPEKGPDSSQAVLPPVLQRKPISNSAFAGPPPVARRKPVPTSLAPLNGLEAVQNNTPHYQSNATPSSSNLLRPDYIPRQSLESAQYQDENRPPLPRRPTQQPASPGTSLTLIRRDPASGAQWNVARIEDPPTLDLSSPTSNDPTSRKRVGAPVYIEITNPGYSKFLHTQPPPLVSRDINEPTGAYHSQSQAPSANQNGASGTDGIFRRRLWMEGAKYPTGDFGHRRLKSFDSNKSGGSPRNSMETTQRDRSSMDSRPPATPPFLTRENQSYSSIQVSEKQYNFRGYVFTSPWNGRCEFITGASGGSLKVCACSSLHFNITDSLSVSPCCTRPTRSSSSCPTR